MLLSTINKMLAQLLSRFCKETIFGMESGYYKFLKEQANSQTNSQEDSKDEMDVDDNTKQSFTYPPEQVIKNNLVVFTTDHFNRIYTALVNGTDEYFAKPFYDMYNSQITNESNGSNGSDESNEMINTNVVKHNYLCLLKMACSIVGVVFINMDRSKLDNTTLESFMNSLDIEVSQFINTLITEETIAHQHFPCDTTDIKTCDPNIKLFEIKVTETNNNNNTNDDNSDEDRPTKRQKYDIVSK